MQKSASHIPLRLKSFLILIFLFLSFSRLSAQLSGTPVLKPDYSYDKFPGYITINELNIGAGLGATNAPYAANYFGFATIHGYQFNQVLIAGGGTGINFYKDGVELPLFADLRFRFFKKYNLTSSLFGDGGVIFNIHNSSSSKITPRLFLNPGVGVRYDVSYTMGLNFGVGVMVQQNNVRNSYLNFKLGLTYKPGIIGKSL